MIKITIIGHKICLLVFLVFGNSVPVFAENMIFHKDLADGRIFELKYFETSTFVTNVDGPNSYHLLDDKGNSIFHTNSLGQATIDGMPLKNYTYSATAYLSTSNSIPIPIWTNQGAWSSPTVGLRTGFEFFDASSDDGNIVVCYKEQFDLYAEKIVLKKPDSTGISNSRQKICSDSFNQEITNAVFIVSNGLPAQIVVTGWLPTKEISWRYEKGNWVQETSK